jgi:hypothetical protein
MSESFNDKLEAFFRAHPDEWIDGMRLGAVAGRFAWRTRVSDVRRRGLQIDNRVRRLKNTEGKPYAVSEYRYVPASKTWTAQQAALFLKSFDVT